MLIYEEQDWHFLLAINPTIHQVDFISLRLADDEKDHDIIRRENSSKS